MVLLQAGFEWALNYKKRLQRTSRPTSEEGTYSRNSLRYKVKSAQLGDKRTIEQSGEAFGD
jgi:hypothetical protein